MSSRRFPSYSHKGLSSWWIHEFVDSGHDAIPYRRGQPRPRFSARLLQLSAIRGVVEDGSTPWAPPVARPTPDLWRHRLTRGPTSQRQERTRVEWVSGPAGRYSHRRRGPIRRPWKPGGVGPKWRWSGPSAGLLFSFPFFYFKFLVLVSFTFSDSYFKFKTDSTSNFPVQKLILMWIWPLLFSILWFIIFLVIYLVKE
jgi:hypothetical protein